MNKRGLLSLALFPLFIVSSLAQSLSGAFDGVQKWNAALTASDTAALKGLYSTAPPAAFAATGQEPATGIAPETEFWEKLLSDGMTSFEVNIRNEQDKNGLHIVTLAISMKAKTADGLRTRYVNEQQAWQQQSGGWRIVIATHSDVVKMPPALKPNPNLYEKDADARAKIKQALARAKKDHQRVILVFGANWCYDCHVLDQAFHQSDVAPLLDRNFQVVHVDIGDDGKKNNDLASEYRTPLNKGVPVLAVLGPDGSVLYSQQNGEWESARSLDPDDVIAFLNRWKP